MISDKQKEVLDDIKKNNEYFTYELGSFMNRADLFFEGVKIAELWGRDEYGHIYTNYVSGKEANEAINVGGTFKYISTGSGIRFNYHPRFILKYSIGLKSYEDIRTRVSAIIYRYIEERDMHHATKSFDEAPYMYAVQYDERMLRHERVKKQ